MQERAPRQPPPTKKSRRLKWLFYLAFWLALVTSFGFLALAQAGQYSQLQADLARLRAETETAAIEHERLLRQFQFIGSDAYVIDQARRLGLVLPTEMVIRNTAMPAR
ncbi:MAG: septum formation initiator family protein [Defluviitaleaceae bacterium]|nr:septum formation initiator family protein [Defluviitaleaceae bacterium]